MSQGHYAAAGVDIDAQDRAIDMIRAVCRSTYRAEVVTDVGSFGGMWAFDANAYREPVLVSSVDGVGTKIKVAVAMDVHDTIGIDLVHHCVNDIAVMGAEPLFFLDYFGTGKLAPEVAAAVVSGLAQGCKNVGCTLIAGEMAEMPGMYQPGEYDVVGTIVGVVERDEVIDGRTVTEGDVILGLPSSGLHTNGYSLARKVLFADAGLAVDETHPALAGTVGEALLAPHRCYLDELRVLRRGGWLKAAAHITGGGLLDNLPRVLPDGLGAELARGRWQVPPIFELIGTLGGVPEQEMARTFNLGLGLLAVVPAAAADEATAAVGGNAQAVGRITAGSGVRLLDGSEF